jgi:hypothetical protein
MDPRLRRRVINTSESRDRYRHPEMERELSDSLGSPNLIVST